MRRALLDDDSGDAESRYLLTQGLSHGGRLRLLVGDPEAARSAFVEALDLCKALVAHDPTNLEWLRNLGVAHRDLGELRVATGEAGEALVELETAIGILEGLVERDPSNVDWLDGLIRARLLAGAAILADGRPEVAAAAIDQAAALLGPRLDAQPNREELLEMRARADLLRAQALDRQGRSAAAQEALEEAHEGLAPVATGTRNVALLDTWARVLWLTGRQRDAEAVTDRLLATGYRRPDFLACCARAEDLPLPAGRGASVPAAGPASPQLL